jgi:ABC-2 type transport system permease protein
MSKAWEFFKRDYIIATSYRTAFFAELATILVLVLILYFLGKDTPLHDAEAATKYGGGLFEFMLVGFGLLGYHATSLRTFTQSIRDSQLMGTLEIVLLTPTSIAQLLFYSSLWIYFFVTIRFVALLSMGALFGFDLSHANVLSVFVVLALAIPAFASFGVASAALVLIIKRGDPISMMISAASLVLGGVLFPAESLPGWMHRLGHLLPLTHALEAMRLALSKGATVLELGSQLGALSIFSFICLPLSLGLFYMAVRSTKASGTLSQY